MGNYVVVVAMSLKNRVNTFDKFHYKSIILLYNKQNRHKSKLPFIYIMVYDGSNIKVKIETSRRWMAI